jgi:hypothetical protein
MTDEVKKEDDGWYIGKYAGKVAKATWEGTKTVGRTIADHPVAGTVGAVGGFVVAGPVGAIGGAAAGAGIAKSVKAENEKEKKDEEKK